MWLNMCKSLTVDWNEGLLNVIFCTPCVTVGQTSVTLFFYICIEL